MSSTAGPRKRIRPGLFPLRTRSWGSGTAGDVGSSSVGRSGTDHHSSSSSSRARLPPQQSLFPRQQEQQPKQQEQEPLPKWMDWVATGVEWLGCDSSATFHTIGGTTNPATTTATMNSSSHTPSSTADESSAAAQLHEDFLDALFQEQVTPATSTTPYSATSFADSATNSMVPQRQDSFNTDASIGSSSISSDGSSLRSHISSFSGSRTTLRKTRTAKYAGRHHSSSNNSASANNSVGGGSCSVSSVAGTVGSVNTYKNSMAAIEEYQRQYAHSGTSTSTPTSITNTAQEPPIANTLTLAPEWIHDDCVLQKDRGKGEPFGSAVKARGKEACLIKLREKMAIVSQVSKDAKSAWKRRPAIVTKNTADYIETRSMMELRLGFLSMQYGLLLHWKRPGSSRTDCETSTSSRPRIVFMVLRKMCHDSFYKVKKSSTSSHHNHHHAHNHHRTSATAMTTTPPRRVISSTALSSRKQPKLCPVIRSPHATSSSYPGATARSSAYHMDAIWEGTNSKGDAEVLWLEPLQDAPPSTLHVKVAKLMMEPSLVAATTSTTTNNTLLDTRWTLNLTMEDGPAQVLTWTHNNSGADGLAATAAGKAHDDEYDKTKKKKTATTNPLAPLPLDELFHKSLHWTGLTRPCNLELRLLKQSPQDKFPTIVAKRTLPLIDWMSQPNPHPSKEIQMRMTLASSLQLTLHFTYESDQAVVWYQTLEKMQLYDDDDDGDGIPDLGSVSSSSSASQEPYDSYLEWFCSLCSFRDYHLC